MIYMIRFGPNLNHHFRIIHTFVKFSSSNSRNVENIRWLFYMGMFVICPEGKDDTSGGSQIDVPLAGKILPYENLPCLKEFGGL